MNQRLRQELENPDGQVITAIDRALITMRWADAHPDRTALPGSDDPWRDRAMGVSFGTAFLVEAGGNVVIVTAGHILKSMAGDGEDGRRIVAKLDLITGAPGHDPDRFVSIPIAELWAGHLDNGGDGEDYGVVGLNGPRLQQLLDQGARPLLESTWKGNQVAYPEAVFAFGFPREYRGVVSHERTAGGYAGRSEAYRAAIQLDIQEYAERGRGKVLRARQVLQRIPGPRPGEFLGSWNGMSGGPIIGFTATDQAWSMTLLAVQSEFDNGIATGCMVHPFLSDLEQQFIALRTQGIPTSMGSDTAGAGTES